MKTTRKRQRQLGALIGIVALVTLVSSTASASIPAGDGTIHGCYRPTGVAQGELVVIDDTDACPTGYTPLDWNKQGPAGVSGYEIVTDAGQTGYTHTTNCPTGKKAISGGVKWNGRTIYPSSSFAIIGSYPTAGGTGWIVDYSLGASTVDVYAVCANAS